MDARNNKRNGNRQLLCRAVHPFQGNSEARQVSFTIGTLLFADTRKQQNGWVWVTIRNSDSGAAGRSGWCPLSYLTPVEEPVPTSPAPASAAPLFPDILAPNQSAHREAANTRIASTPFDDNDDLFGGAPMGGAWNEANDPNKDIYVPQSVTSNPTPQPTKVHNSHQFGSGVRIRKAGTFLSQSASRAGSAIAKGATTAGNGMKTVAQETKQRVQEIHQKQQQQQQEHDPHHPQKGYATQQTPGQQNATNIGNRAAQSAVVWGVVGGALGGPQGAVRGATRGALFGGTSEAVKGWKPFGK